MTAYHWLHWESAGVAGMEISVHSLEHMRRRARDEEGRRKRKGRKAGHLGGACL